MEAVPSLQSALLRPHTILGFLHTRQIQDTPEEEHGKQSRDWSVLHTRDWKHYDCLAWRRDQSGRVSMCISIWLEDVESELDSSQWYPVKGWGNGHKLKYWKLFKQKAFTLRVMKHWNRLLRGCKVSILGDIQNQTGHGPYQPALSDSPLCRGLTKESPEVPSSILNYFRILQSINSTSHHPFQRA